MTDVLAVHGGVEPVLSHAALGVMRRMSGPNVTSGVQDTVTSGDPEDTGLTDGPQRRLQRQRQQLLTESFLFPAVNSAENTAVHVFLILGFLG